MPLSAKKTQQRLVDVTKITSDTCADVAVAQWAIAHDIPANALKGIYWKRVNKSLQKVSPGYVAMNPNKLKSTMIPVLKKMALADRDIKMKHDPTVGRTVTGDGATKKVSLINFLVFVPGKGPILLDVTDCTGHMAEGGIKDAMYVYIFTKVYINNVKYTLYVVMQVRGITFENPDRESGPGERYAYRP